MVHNGLICLKLTKIRIWIIQNVWSECCWNLMPIKFSVTPSPNIKPKPTKLNLAQPKLFIDLLSLATAIIRLFFSLSKKFLKEWYNLSIVGYCQARSKPKLYLQLWAELFIIYFSPANQPDKSEVILYTSRQWPFTPAPNWPSMKNTEYSKT